MQEILGPEITIRSAYEALGNTKRAWVDAYVMHGDVRKAWDAIMPGARDYVQPYRWAKEPLILAAIAERMSTAAARYEITLDRVLREIGGLAISSLKPFMRINPDSKLPYYDFSEITDEQWAAVAEIAIEETLDDQNRTTRKVKVKMHDKKGALDMLMKRFGAYAPQRHELTGANGAPLNGVRSQDAITVNMTAQQAAEQYAKVLRGDE